ncbi:MAG: XdhC family protein [Desulfobacteraceae bacterium]
MFHEIHQALLDGQALAVATIIGDRGSPPLTSGSKMMVYRNGGISGTIGGGAVEGDVIQRAKPSLQIFSDSRKNLRHSLQSHCRQLP